MLLILYAFDLWQGENLMIEEKENRDTVFSTAESVDGELRVRWLLANNPNTPPQVLDSIIASNHLGLIRRVAEHPRLSLPSLEALCSHTDAQVREAVSENPNLPPSLMWTLAQDASEDVRFRLAESYTVDQEVLSYLMEDENPYVAQRARQTMRRRNMHLYAAVEFPAIQHDDAVIDLRRRGNG